LARAHTCNDCYFRARSLCALARSEPCPTFRLAKNGRPARPPQAPLVAVVARAVPVEGPLVAARA
jgi:hypothetical protein